MVGLHFYADNENKLIPNKWSIFLESSFASFNSMVREQIGSLNEIYLPVLCFGKTLFWVWLSYSGNALKIMIPNYILNFISGWTNPSGMVTSYNMNENKMGNRGSKSVILTKTVKEQRVDGSWGNNYNKKLLSLRCTLMGFERNYQVKNLSKQFFIYKYNYSTFNFYRMRCLYSMQ